MSDRKQFSPDILAVAEEDYRTMVAVNPAGRTNVKYLHAIASFSAAQALQSQKQVLAARVGYGEDARQVHAILATRNPSEEIALTEVVMQSVVIE